MEVAPCGMFDKNVLEAECVAVSVNFSMFLVSERMFCHLHRGQVLFSSNMHVASSHVRPKRGMPGHASMAFRS